MILKNKFHLFNSFFPFLLMSMLLSACQKHYYIKNVNTNGYRCTREYIGDTVSNNYEEKISVYYPSGELNRQYTIINHLKEHDETFYYSNGILGGEANYLHNKLEGIRKVYYQSGQLAKEAMYSNNKINGLYWQYYLDGKLSNYGFFKDSTPIYYLAFDTTGKKIIDMIRPYLQYDRTIHLGDKFNLKVICPILKGFTNITELNIAIVPTNIIITDSLKDYSLYSKIINKKWTYQLYNHKSDIAVNDYTGPLINISLNKQGNGSYEFTPTNAGQYQFVGVSTSFNSAESSIDTAFTQSHFKINFTVIK